MKNLRKCSLAFAVLFSCSILVQSFVPFRPGTNTVDTEMRSVATATETTNPAAYYFYQQLSNAPMAQKFYGALAAMEKGGLFKSGIAEYDLIESGVLTEDEVMGYINNADSTILLAFGAARDAFILDNPSLFYVNADNLGVTIGTKGGRAYAALGTGRDDSYCVTEEWEESDVEKAVETYQAKVKEIAEAAKANGETTADKIAYVNDWLCKNVTYSFCEEHVDGKDTYPDGKLFCDLRSTAYGSLVNGKGVCESFARGLKAVMDELEIPCVLVYGTGDGEPHMWNYVQLDGRWYAVDATWNNTSKELRKYYLKGEVDFEHDHIPSGVLSDFEFGYPELSKYQYGISADEEGVVFTPEYYDSDGVTNLKLSFSYNGKSVSKLHEEGIYVAFRYIQRNTTVQDLIASPWFGAYESSPVFACQFEEEETKDSVTTFYLHPGIESIQLMLVKKAPDDAGMATDPDTGEPYYYMYKAEEFKPDDIIENVNSYANDAYGTYFPAPGITASIPGNHRSLSTTGEFMDCKLTFNEDLVPIDEWVDENDSGAAAVSAPAIEVSQKNSTGKTPISIEMIGTHPDVGDYAEVRDVVWDPSTPNVISFKFMASPQFKHTYETYTFYVHGLVGKVSGKEPGAYILNFAKRYTLCPKVFNDGRDYIICYGEPQIVANEDLSTSGWTDEAGNVFSASQRSQMMLVVNDLDSEDKKTVLDEAAKQDNTDREKILTSATYEIDLQICRRYPRIPNGSYVQVSIGFPDGTTYEDFKDGSKTLKMYHYKRGKDGKIDPKETEEINLTVTPYGLVAKITSFSPFAVVVYDGKEVPAPKRISASVLGKGGTVSGPEVTTFSENKKTITYTLMPKEGYQVDKVLVNEKEIKIAEEGSGAAGVTVGTDEKGHTTLTFSENELEFANTLLQVSFAAQRVVKQEEENEITPVQKTLVLESDQIADIVPVAPPASDNPSTPEVPDVPDIPNVPEEPEEPSDPDTPSTPEEPEEPSNPDTPSTPEEPGKPSTPDTPSTPEEPGKPSIPDTPSSPVVPANPSNPSAGNGGNSGNSSGSNTLVTKPEESETTEKPDTSDTPSIPEVVPSVPTEPEEPDAAELVPSVKNFDNAKKPTVSTKVKKDSKKVSLQWDEIAGADGYKIYQYDADTGKYQCIKTITDPATTAFSKKMKQASSYSFKVRAFVNGEDGNKTYGKYSAVINAVIPPNTIKGLKIQSEGVKITLSWKEVKNADGYQVFRSKKKNGTYSRMKTVKKGSSDVVIKQAGNQKYYYKVRAFVKDADGNRICGGYGKAVSAASSK